MNYPCRLKILAKSTKGDFYLELGELYNPKKDINLCDIHRDLQYLTIFRCKIVGKNVICYNVEDIRFIQEKYGFTTRIFPSKSVTGVYTFHQPILWDDTCKCNVYISNRSLCDHVYIPNRYCIMLPCKNPVQRGELLDKIIMYNPHGILLSGGKKGENRDTEATLGARYLLHRNFKHESITKFPESGQDSILDCLNLLELVDIPKDSIIYIACPAEGIGEIRMKLKFWRKKNFHNVSRFFFITE